MKTINNLKIVKKYSEINWVVIILPVFCGSALFRLFLSGKIIKIPYGTHEGGVIAAIGYFAILIITIAIGVLSQFLVRKFSGKSDL